MPRLMSTVGGTTLVSEQGRLWELSTWMPGSSDFCLAPTPARLTAVCEALARLHDVWAPTESRQELCPALMRRWDSLRSWQELVQSGWRPAFSASDPYADVAEPLWHWLPMGISTVPALLSPWSQRTVATQPCVCDLWHDHVLFTGDTVTGIVDFGSVKIDHPAVDLARLLGSMVEDDDARWSEGFAAYARIRPLSAQDQELVRILDRTGTILAATHWLRWLYLEKRAYAQRDAVLRRLMTLQRRVANIRA
jgi:homoserine kinase type II